MSYALTEEALEEGRVALYQLERQLKERNGLSINDNASEGSSRQQSSLSERKMLDQVPREARLNNRLQSLGLTVEELDDRGLLDGGGSVPSYYTSMKQRSRRVMELQPRSHRLQERGKEALTKLLNGLFHMLRILSRKGLDLEAYCLQRDPKKTGIVSKKHFYHMLKSIGLPFGTRELQEITHHYALPSSDHADYVSFLKDSRITMKSNISGSSFSSPGGTTHDSDAKNADLASHTTVLLEVKRMLLESIRSLNKHPDDVYRMFARWDTQGTGTVTATQFLRVLIRLHIDLSDQDQDYLVELLDTNAMGRIDFESLLTYCFSGSDSDLTSSAIVTGLGTLSIDDQAVETLSAVSTENNSTEQKSLNSGVGASRRPRTATISRPYNEAISQNNYYQQQTPTMQSSNPILKSINGPRQQYTRGDAVNNTSPRAGAGGLQRPLTAAGRVSSRNKEKVDMREEEVNKDNRFKQFSDQRTYSQRIQQHVDNMDVSQFVKELPDDVIHGEEKYLGADNRNDSFLPPAGRFNDNNTAEALNSSRSKEMEGKPISPSDQEAADGPDSISYNDNADLEEYNFGSHKEIPAIVSNRSGWATGAVQGPLITGMLNNNGGNTSDQWKNAKQNPVTIQQQASRPPLQPLFMPSNGPTQDLVESPSDRSIQQDPIDHLVLLAHQILSTLRDFIMTSYRRGRSLQEIYQHFDRDHKRYFDARDFILATSELRIETSDRVAAIAIQQIAIDSIDKVTFGEFKVFVLDSDHKQLAITLQEQLAQLLEQQGREYQSWMIDKFYQEEELRNGSSSIKSQQQGLISKNAFISALEKIGAVLTSSEVHRLVDRFDVHGDERCSLDRFIRMIHESGAWKNALAVLTYQEQAVEEAKFLRQQLMIAAETGSNNPSLPLLPEELISMCEYLGIRVLSEPQMLWIAADALKAPLPVSWTAQKDRNGRTYFYNHLSNQSKWEHPLDPHFRKLRDKYRQSSDDQEFKGMIKGPVASPKAYMLSPSLNGNGMVAHGDSNPGSLFGGKQGGFLPSFDQTVDTQKSIPLLTRSASMNDSVTVNTAEKSNTGIADRTPSAVPFKGNRPLSSNADLGDSGGTYRVKESQNKPPSISKRPQSAMQERTSVRVNEMTHSYSENRLPMSGTAPQPLKPINFQGMSLGTRPSSAPQHQQPGVVKSQSQFPHPDAPLDTSKTATDIFQEHPSFKAPDVNSNTQAVIEAIYSSAFYRSVPNTSGKSKKVNNRSMSRERQQQNSLSAYNSSIGGFSTSSKNRPSSSKVRNTNNGASAVDKAVSMGKKGPAYLQVKGAKEMSQSSRSKKVDEILGVERGSADWSNNPKLNVMFDSSIIDKLDHVIPPISNSGKNSMDK